MPSRSEVVASADEVVAELALVEDHRRQSDVRAHRDRLVVEDGRKTVPRVGSLRVAAAAAGVTTFRGRIALHRHVERRHQRLGELVNVVRHRLVFLRIVGEQVMRQGDVRHGAAPRVPPFGKGDRVLAGVVDPHAAVVSRAANQYRQLSSQTPFRGLAIARHTLLTRKQGKKILAATK